MLEAAGAKERGEEGSLELGAEKVATVSLPVMEAGVEGAEGVGIKLPLLEVRAAVAVAGAEMAAAETAGRAVEEAD